MEISQNFCGLLRIYELYVQLQKSGFLQREIFLDSLAICGKKKQKSKDTQDAQKQPQCVRSVQLQSCPNMSKLKVKGSTRRTPL